NESPEKLSDLLTTALKRFGSEPGDWEIYRGDEFQLKLIDPGAAFLEAVYFKGLLKSLKGLDLCIGIGVGEESYQASQITQSNGSAYVRSGRVYDEAKSKRVRFMIRSGNDTFDQSFNLMLKLAATFMVNWSPTSAATMAYVLENPDRS